MLSYQIYIDSDVHRMVVLSINDVSLPQNRVSMYMKTGCSISLLLERVDMVMDGVVVSTEIEETSVVVVVAV